MNDSITNRRHHTWQFRPRPNPDPKIGAAVGEELRLPPTLDAAEQAASFVCKALLGWHRAGVYERDLASAAGQFDQNVVVALMEVGVWSIRGRFQSRVWTRLERSRWVRANTGLDSQYWLMCGRARWRPPRWETDQPLAQRVDRRRPVVFGVRLEGEGSSLRLRMEVRDQRVVSDLDDPEVESGYEVDLDRTCVAWGRLDPDLEAGRMTWAVVDLHHSHPTDMPPPLGE